MIWEYSNRFQKDLKQYKKDKNKSDLDRIKVLLEDTEVNGLLCCLGKPELLRNNFKGCYSRRINKKDRLVYQQKKQGTIQLISCKYHY
ncbi:MAG: Txe/YoeB family addiction module toxin [Cyclobacteriaceae bacterium]